MNVQQKTKGFTIIEVVLVLAIAGLIFLIIFLALPALQRSQRDTQRRSDIGRVIAASQSYQSNNSGATPFTYNASGIATSMGTLVSGYMDNNYNDPSTNAAYALATTIVPTSANQLAIYKAADCAAAAASATGAKTIFRMFLESGGYICQAN